MVVNTIEIEPNQAIETSGSDIVTEARPPPEDVSIAVKTFQEALAVERKKLGPQHSKSLNTLHHLAIALRDNGYLEMAKDHFEEELRVLREKDGDNKIEIAFVLTNIGKLNNQLGSSLDAIAAYKNAVKLYKNAGLKKDHPRLAMTSRMLKRLQRKIDAENPV